MTDAQKEILKEQIRHGGIPPLPADLNVDPETRDLYRNLRDQVEAAPRGTLEYEQPLFAIHALIKDLEAQAPGETEWGNLQGRHEFNDPDTGRKRIQEWDDRGNIIDVELDTAAAEQAEATMRLRVDERAAIRLDVRESDETLKTASTISDPVAAKQLRDRAVELHAKAMERLGKLRESVPPEEWPQYDLGATPVLSDEERQAIELAQDDKIDALADVWMDLNPEQQQVVLHAVPPEKTGWLKALIEHVESEEE